MSVYDQHTPKGGDFAPLVKWEPHMIGAPVVLTVTGVRLAQFEGADDKTIVLDGVDPAGNELAISGGPFRLEALLMSHRPEVGDTVQVTYLGLDGKAKSFDLQVLNRGGQAPAAAPAAAPAPAAPYVPPAAPAAAPPAQPYTPPPAPAAPAPAPAPAAPYVPPAAPAPAPAPAAPPTY